MEYESDVCFYIFRYNLYDIVKNYNFSKKSSKASNCSGSSLAAYFNSCICLSFKRTIFSLLSSKKNWDIVMSKASHILVREDIEGNIFFLYHEEMVD